MWDSIKISASVYDSQFTDNNIYLYYFHEPSYKLLSAGETPSNIPTDLMIQTLINPEDLENLIKYGDSRCRFTSSSGYEMFTEGIFVHSYIAEGGDTSN
jgi:hypothetical protein